MVVAMTSLSGARVGKVQMEAPFHASRCRL